MVFVDAYVYCLTAVTQKYYELYSRFLRKLEQLALIDVIQSSIEMLKKTH